MKKWLYSVCAAAMMLGAAEAYTQEKKPVPPAERPHHEQRMEQMEDKLAQELGLTAEQQVQAKKIRQEGRKKVKPLMDEMKDIRKKMDEIVDAFAKVPVHAKNKVRVGIVGEIYVKFAPLGNNNLEEFLLKENAEPVVPGLLDFILLLSTSGTK